MPVRDRFRTAIESARVLLAAGRIGLATALLEDELLMPPKEGESSVFYLKIRDFIDLLRPEDAGVWACIHSPNGFCVSDESGICPICSEPHERR